MKKVFLAFAALLALTAGAWPQTARNANSQVTVVGVFPPMVSTSAYFSTYRTNVLPNINGVTMGVLWAQGNVFGSTDVGIESNTTPGSYNWSGFDTAVEGYSSQTCGANTPQGAHPCKIFFGTGMAESKGLQQSGVGNTYTPQYVFSQSWANSSAPTWSSGTLYWAKQDVVYHGTYYQNTGTNGTCTSTGSGGPATDTGCPWTNTGANAAPQDATFDAIVPPGSNSLWPPQGNAVNVNSTICTNGTTSCPASTVAMGLPVTFETPVYAAFQPFLAAFFAHIAAAPYASQVVYVRGGIGQELDESFIWSITTVEPLSGGNITAMGNTWLALHANFVKMLAAARNANFPTVGLNITVNGGVGTQPYAWATQMAADAVSIDAGVGCECLSLTDLANYWSGAHCTNNWCSAFQTYGAQAPFLELQELEPSVPGGATGTMDQFLPFGLQMRMNKPLYIEIIASDLECAYISTYTGTNCPGSAPWVPFQNTLQQLSFGVPAPLGAGLTTGNIGISASSGGGSIVTGCPPNVPAGVTTCYYIDYVAGNDSNSGTSSAAPWQHVPGMANASGTPAGHTPGPGEGWLFKGGVTVDWHAYPMNVPWGGTSGHPDYMGYNTLWYAGASWARPIINGGGSSGYNSNTSSLITDAAHNASYLVIDDFEFTGLYFSGTNCGNVGPDQCGYVGWHSFYSGTGSNWEIKNVYAHNVTHSGYPTSNDPANNGALFWMPQDAGSSFHDSVGDNTDGGADCCLLAFTGNIYNVYASGFDNTIFNPNGGETVFLLHDSTFVNMVSGFVPSGGPHGNCIHIFGNKANNELIWNNYIDCNNAADEAFEIEEDAATVYAFNNVWTNIVQPNGLNPSSFSGAGHGGTYTLFQNTIECGIDPTPVQECFKLSYQPTVTGVNNFGITNNSNAATVGKVSFTGTYTYSPTTFSISCAGGVSNPQTNWGGSQICAPIGSGNGTGNLNITETYPFAPMDSTAAASIGTAAGQEALCTAVSAINAAAGTACLSDTTLGVSYNTGNHTVSWPARTPIAHPTGASPWQIGAYEE